MESLPTISLVKNVKIYTAYISPSANVRVHHTMQILLKWDWKLNSDIIVGTFKVCIPCAFHNKAVVLSYLAQVQSHATGYFSLCQWWYKTTQFLFWNGKKKNILWLFCIQPILRHWNWYKIMELQWGPFASNTYTIGKMGRLNIRRPFYQYKYSYYKDRRA